VTANILDPDFDERRTHPGFGVSRAFVGRQAGARRLGASVWELEPGQKAYPYHYHLVEEELIVVLAGRPSVRTPEGWSDLEPGDVVCFPRGEEGAHQLANNTEEAVRFLAISTSGEPEIAVYPDQGKFGLAERRPDGGGVRLFFQRDSAVDYWDGVDA